MSEKSEPTPILIPPARQDAIAHAKTLYETFRLREAAQILTAIKFSRQQKTTPEYAHYCCILGSVYAETGDFSHAVELFTEAEHYYKEHNQLEALVFCL